MIDKWNKTRQPGRLVGPDFGVTDAAVQQKRGAQNYVAAVALNRSKWLAILAASSGFWCTHTHLLTYTHWKPGKLLQALVDPGEGA